LKKNRAFSKGWPSGSLWDECHMPMLQSSSPDVSKWFAMFAKLGVFQWLSKVGRLDAKHPQLKTNKLSFFNG